MSFTTATACLPDGNYIRYMDSGPVEGSSTYTTIVMLHGSCFNSYVFEPLHPLAAQLSLRLIAVQRKDYTGSSPYTDTELQDLHKGDPAFFDRLTVLLGHLLQHLIRTHELPKPNTERTEGGVVLLGWSIGCATAISLLSNASLLGQEQHDFLSQYLTNLVLYDPPIVSLGFEGTMRMLGKTVEEHYSNFKWCVSSYFDTPKDWDGNQTKLDQRTRTERTTINPWSEELLEKIYQAKSAARSEVLMIKEPAQNALRDLTQRALFNEAVVRTTFPEVSLIHIVCWRSCQSTLLAYHKMQMHYQQRQAKNMFVRPLSFEAIKNVNHFWHWDYPEDFLNTLARSVRGGRLA